MSRYSPDALGHAAPERRQLTDSETMSPAAPLGIVHIPKTGGYAVRSALSAVCRLDESPAYHDAQLIAGTSIRDLPRPTQDTFVTARRLREIGHGRQVLIGHYSAPTLVAAGCAELAVQLREPRIATPQPLSLLAVPASHSRGVGSMGPDSTWVL